MARASVTSKNAPRPIRTTDLRITSATPYHLAIGADRVCGEVLGADYIGTRLGCVLEKALSAI